MTNENEQIEETSTAGNPAAAAERKTKKANKKAAAARVKPTVSPEKATARKKASPAKKAPKAAKGAKPARAHNGQGAPREGSKTATVLGLLKRPTGAILAEIMAATGWQAHSVRGFISGTLGKQMDLQVISFKNEAGDRAYRIDK